MAQLRLALGLTVQSWPFLSIPISYEKCFGGIMKLAISLLIATLITASCGQKNSSDTNEPSNRTSLDSRTGDVLANSNWELLGEGWDKILVVVQWNQRNALCPSCGTSPRVWTAIRERKINFSFISKWSPRTWRKITTITDAAPLNCAAKLFFKRLCYFWKDENPTSSKL